MIPEEEPRKRSHTTIFSTQRKQLPKGFEKGIIELEFMLEKHGMQGTPQPQSLPPAREIITKLIALYSVGCFNGVNLYRTESSTTTPRGMPCTRSSIGIRSRCFSPSQRSFKSTCSFSSSSRRCSLPLSSDRLPTTSRMLWFWTSRCPAPPQGLYRR